MLASLGCGTPAYIGRSAACPWAQTPGGAGVAGAAGTAVGAAAARRPARQVRAPLGAHRWARRQAWPRLGPAGAGGTVSPEGSGEAAGGSG